MATPKVARGKCAPKKRTETPVADQIRRAARRAGIAAVTDTMRITVARGDLELAAHEIREAFDEFFAAEMSDEPAEHDALLLRALRRLRGAQSLVELAANRGAA